MVIKSIGHIRRIARHLINFPKPETTRIINSLPSDDRIRVLEEIKRIKDGSKLDD